MLKFQQSMNDWEEKKNKNIQMEQYQKMAEEMEGITFMPSINKKSKKLAMKKKLQRKNIY